VVTHGLTWLLAVRSVTKIKEIELPRKLA